jgi:hypothetical protein
VRSIETTGSTSGEWPGAAGKRLWRGYRTTKAIAWVIDVGVSKPAWLARYKDQCCGPMSLKDAKTAALAMAKGAFGDYRVADPLSHLNGMSARLLDAEAA